MKAQILKISDDLRFNKIDDKEAKKLLLDLFLVSESLEISDIRNKLTPVTLLIDLIDKGEDKEWVDKASQQAKKSVNYLAKSNIYSR